MAFKTQLSKEEEENNRKYHVPGMPNFARRTKNTIVYAANNTTLHELSKALGGLMLHKWGDVKFTEAVKKKLKELSISVDQAYQNSPKVRKAYITEAVPNNQPTRRVDLVRLEDDYRYEFEVSNHKNKKDPERQEKTITINV